MVTSAPSTPSGVFQIPILDKDEGSTSGECGLMVATSNAGAGERTAFTLGDAAPDAAPPSGIGV